MKTWHMRSNFSGKSCLFPFFAENIFKKNNCGVPLSSSIGFCQLVIGLFSFFKKHKSKPKHLQTFEQKGKPQLLVVFWFGFVSIPLAPNEKKTRISLQQQKPRSLTFDWSSQVSFPDVVVFDKKWAIFITLANPFGEDGDVGFHHFHRAAMFDVHPAEWAHSNCLEEDLLKEQQGTTRETVPRQLYLQSTLLSAAYFSGLKSFAVITTEKWVILKERKTNNH